MAAMNSIVLMGVCSPLLPDEIRLASHRYGKRKTSVLLTVLGVGERKVGLGQDSKRVQGLLRCTKSSGT